MFKAPEWTQVPNQLFDSLIPTLKEGELRVLLVILRQTFGWHKDWDRIPISQLMSKTGMKRKAVCNSTTSLIKKCLIKKVKSGECGTEQVYYCLCVEDKQSNGEIVSENPPCSNNLDQYPKDTGTSILKIPSKETLPKERKKEIYKEKILEPRKKYGEYVELTDAQFKTVCDKYGRDEVMRLIEAINLWVPNNKKYKDYAAAIGTWHNNEEKFSKPHQQKKVQQKVSLPSKEKDSSIEILNFVDNLIARNTNLKDKLSLENNSVSIHTPSGIKKSPFDSFTIPYLQANLQSWFGKNIIL